jgi:hypothetical protein
MQRISPIEVKSSKNYTIYKKVMAWNRQRRENT